MFKESNCRSLTLSIESGTGGRKPVNTGEEYQLDMGSASNRNSPLYLIAGHQKAQLGNPQRHQTNEFFDNVISRKCFSEIDGIRYRKDPIDINYTENVYIDGYGKIKLFYKELVGESLLNSCLSNSDMKNFYWSQWYKNSNRWRNTWENWTFWGISRRCSLNQFIYRFDETERNENGFRRNGKYWNRMQLKWQYLIWKYFWINMD